MSLRDALAGEAKDPEVRSRSESEPEHDDYSRQGQTRNQVIYPWAG